MILPCSPRTDPIRKGARRRQTNTSTNENGEIHKADALRIEVVWRCGEVLRLRQVDRKEGTAGPGDDKGRELDDGEEEELPGDEEVDGDRLEWVRGRRIDTPLFLAGRAFAEPWVAFGGWDVCERSVGLHFGDGADLLCIFDGIAAYGDFL